MSVEREMSLVEWCAKLPMCHAVNRELAALNNKLAALAEQNEKFREFLSNMIPPFPLQQFSTVATWRVQEVLSLPDLATPVLNRIRAEALNKAAKWFNDNVDNRTDTWQAQELRRMAAELEKTND